MRERQIGPNIVQMFVWQAIFLKRESSKKNNKFVLTQLCSEFIFSNAQAMYILVYSGLLNSRGDDGNEIIKQRVYALKHFNKNVGLARMCR